MNKHAGTKRPRPVGPSAAELERIIQEAIAENRHSLIAQWRTVCDGCREWVNAIFYTTLDHKRLCGPCADKIGQGPIADARQVMQ